MTINLPLRIHFALKEEFNINLNSDEMGVSSLVFVLNYLGIKTGMSCGGHYKELDQFTNSKRGMYGRGGPNFPWVNYRYEKENEALFTTIDKIAQENLWVTTYDCVKNYNTKYFLPFAIMFPDKELIDISNKFHIQQLQLETVNIASLLIKECTNYDVSRELGLIQEHYDSLLKQHDYLNNL